MDEPKVQAAPNKPLKYNKKSPLSFGLPLRDLTGAEVQAWVRSQAQYDEILASKAYSAVETPVDATPAADSGATDAASIQEDN